MYICNDLDFITRYHIKSIKIEKLILNRISLKQRNVCLCLSLKRGEKGIIFDLKNVFFLLNSLSNLVSLGLLNDYRIFHNNENKILYSKKTKTHLIYAQ